ncbi:UNVERIFIED_ORG: hypothetical protein M2193_008361 [Bradyrhizobium japonicum]|uniref:hypothetical protein n=1 Tax=Bradyrhizobium diazoefficiens TaxID=1355477 RepID=UPI00346A17A6
MPKKPGNPSSASRSKERVVLKLVPRILSNTGLEALNKQKAPPLSKPRQRTPEEIEAMREANQRWLEEYLQSDEFKELERKDEAKRQRDQARRSDRSARLKERRRNPQTPIDAYRNWMEQCPYPSGSKKRKEWKKANPLSFNGVTYADHWSPQLSNSGKTTRWHGWLTGSDGSRHDIIDEHINNRRNDADRNWGLPD